MSPVQSLITSCTTLVALTLIVGLRMLFTRIGEMQKNKIHPQSIALSGQRSQKLQDSRAADNFSNLFEVPVLFYTLCIAAIAAQHIPGWLPIAAWIFVSLRMLHSLIHCTYNKVMHRFVVFFAGFALIALMWIAFAISINSI